MKKLQDKSSFLRKKDASKPSPFQPGESPTADQAQQSPHGSLYRPTPIPNDTSSMSRGVSSQSSLASVGEEPGTTSADEGSDVHLTSAPSLHRPTPMPMQSAASADRSRRGSQATGLPPLVEDGGIEAEVVPGVPLLVTTRSFEGRTRSPSPDLRRVSPKVWCCSSSLCGTQHMHRRMKTTFLRTCRSRPMGHTGHRAIPTA